MGEDAEFEKMAKFPIWKEKYSQLGVTPRELYMRQTGLCWLVSEDSTSNELEIHCTDGKDSAVTDHMLNPTLECIQCMARFTKRVMSRDGKF